ncbi:MAG TPA: ubiquinol oxidase subunit II [Candidatus Saccharimonadales bacterium]|nr:ubiquinol oxidase subunit II [Candidatus Saccharimonadales bacterium]
MVKFRKKIFCIAGTLLALLVIAILYLHNRSFAVLSPRGPVSHKEKSLIVFAAILSCIVVIPVYALTIVIALRYRETNRTRKVKYRPNSDHSRIFEGIWWGIPLIIVSVLSVVTWQSSHALDPYKSLDATVKSINIQVVNLDWKWLFIYPDNRVASVNQVAIPVNTPINFVITSDTVMNSFWIPQLGSQIYAMPGMITQLHLMATKGGDYYGSPANISGKGFASMTFDVKALSTSAFNTWISHAEASSQKLSLQAYERLSAPSVNNPVEYFSSPSTNLFTYTVMKYMEPGGTQ